MRSTRIALLSLILSISASSQASKEAAGGVVSKALVTSAFLGATIALNGVTAGLSMKAWNDIQKNNQISDTSKLEAKSALRASQGLYWISMALTILSARPIWHSRDLGSLALPLGFSMFTAVLALVGAGMLSSTYAISSAVRQPERDAIRHATTAALATGISAAVFDWAYLAYVTWLVAYGSSLMLGDPSPI